MDDPFILASQADKVLYATDPKNVDWEVVRHVKVRDLFDMGGDDDQVARNPYDDTFDVPSLHRVGDDGMDVTPEMEVEGEDSEEIEDD